MGKKYEIVINIASRRGADMHPHIMAELSRQNIHPDKIHLMRDPKRLGSIVDAVKKRHPDVLIVASGDGTVSDVVDYLADSKIELLFVPLGTTNNFARSLGLPIDPIQALQTGLQSPAKPIALGQVNNDHFANVAGFGISAEVARSVTNTLKKRFGRLAYALVGLKVLLRHKPFRVTIADKDSELVITLETHQLIVANGRYHAGKVIAKEAHLHRPELVVFALGSRSKLSFMYHTIDFYLGKRKSLAHSSYYSSTNITVATSYPVSYELDGEVKGMTPAGAVILPNAILARM